MKPAAPCRRLRPSGHAVSRAAIAVALCALGATAHCAGAALEGQPATAATSSASAPSDRRLDVAASPTARATQSVMLAVASVGDRIVAAGERGLVVYSDDCGATWQQGRVPVSVTLTSLRFVDERQGWAVGHGGIVLVTRDAGATWQKQLDGRAIALLALAAAKATAAVATTEETRRALSDAERLVAEGPDKPLFALHFWSPKRGIVVGAYGIALATEDGGAHWHWIGDRIPNPKGLHLYGLWAQESHVWLAGEQGLVLRSDDSGRRFQRVASPYAGSFFGVAGTSPDTASDVVVFGLRGHAFRLSTQTSELLPLNVGVRASLLTMLPRAEGRALLFDANGQIVELRDEQQGARPAGSSPVGPVLGATRACGNNLALAGLRGVALVDADTMAVVHEKRTVK